MILSARRYKNSSNFSNISNAKESFMAPTTRIDSGHKSRNSKTNGRRLYTLTIQAPHAVKNCGEVPMTTSTLLTNTAAITALTMKLM